MGVSAANRSRPCGPEVVPVSVVLTSYNHGPYIRQAIDSILAQTFTDFELIIWDDGSTDDSWDIIQSYDDVRIRAFRHEKNQRYVLNSAIREAVRGEYIAVHHSDDVWEPQKLERQLPLLENQPQLGAVFTWATIIDEQGVAGSVRDHFYTKIFDQPNRTRFEWLNFFFYHGNALCHPSLLIRRQCFEVCGLFRRGLIQLPDFDMWIRVCLRYDIHVLPERLVRFRLRSHEANASGNRPETQARTAIEFHLILQHYRQLRDRESLLAVFPQAASRMGEGFDPDYVLAMMALEGGKVPAWRRLWAIALLHELLGDPQRAERLAREQGFGYRDFIALVGQSSIFRAHGDEAKLARLVESEQRAAELERERNELRLHLLDEGDRLAQQQVRLEALLVSHSWRLTAPLRQGHRLWQRALSWWRPKPVMARQVRPVLLLLATGEVPCTDDAWILPVVRRLLQRYDVLVWVEDPAGWGNAFRRVGAAVVTGAIDEPPGPWHAWLLQHGDQPLQAALVHGVAANDYPRWLALQGIPVLSLIDPWVALTTRPLKAEATLSWSDRTLLPSEALWHEARRHYPTLTGQQVALLRVPEGASDAALDRYLDGLEEHLRAVLPKVAQRQRDLATIEDAGGLSIDLNVLVQPSGLSRAEYGQHYLRSWSSGVRRLRPHPGFHPGIYAAHGGAVPEGDDPYAAYLRAGRPAGAWMRPVILPCATPRLDVVNLRIALHLHVFYPELLGAMRERLDKNQTTPDLFVSLGQESQRAEVMQGLAGYRGKILVESVPNRGRDIGPLLTHFAPQLSGNYDIIGHLHTKMSPHADRATVERWYLFLLENLLGGKGGAMMDTLLTEMAHNPGWGLVFPGFPLVIGWDQNRQQAEQWAARLGMGEPLPEHFDFPAGNMFWARRAKLQPLFDLSLGWEDYPPEPLAVDGTSLHALERLLPLIPTPSCPELAMTHVPGLLG